MTDAVSGIANNCDIIRRLAAGDLSPVQFDAIGAVLATGRSLRDVESEDAAMDMLKKTFFGGGSHAPL